MIQGVFVIPLYLIAKTGADYEDITIMACTGFRFTYMLTFYNVVMNVLLLALDRLLAVLLIQSYQNVVTKKTVIIVSVFSWLYMLVLCSLPFVPFRRSRSLQDSPCIYNQPRGWTIFMLIAHALFPFTTIIISYIIIRKKLSTLRAYFEQSSNSFMTTMERKEREKDRREAAFNNKITKLLFLMILIYSITWAPSIIYYSIQQISPRAYELFMSSHGNFRSQLERKVSFVIKYINFFDGVGAPIIYCYHHDEFRKEFKRIMCKKRIRLRPDSFRRSRTLSTYVPSIKQYDMN